MPGPTSVTGSAFTTRTAWTAAFNGVPLYTAKDATNRPQPITATPVWLPHPDGGLMIVFGTGRNLSDNDRADTSAQSIYGVRDNTAVNRDSANILTLSGGAPITDGRAALIAQTPSTTSTGANDSGTRLWTLSSNKVDYTGVNTKKGWYVDLPDAGERVLSNLSWFDGLLVDAPSTVPNIGNDPAVETCTPQPTTIRGYLNTMNAVTGAAPKSQIYAYTSLGPVGTGPSEKIASRIESGIQYGVKSQSEEKAVCASGQCSDRMRLGKASLRPSWRQLQ